MSAPDFPAEFFSIADLVDMAGSPQRARVLQWLRDANIVHVVGLHGWPLVYRTALLPSASKTADNESPQFNFGAARAASRPPSHIR